MELFVLRHAIAVPHGAPGYERDSDRPLTPKGTKRMRRVARMFNAMGISVDAILTSPFPRALETAEIVAKELGFRKDLVLTEHLAVGGDPECLISQINESHGDASGVMICGHEPYLSQLIAVLLSGSAGLIDLTMKKGGLCKLSAETLHFDRCATLEWILTPGILTKIQE